MKEFTNEELKKIHEAIAADQTYGDLDEVDLDDYRIVRTQETTDDFKNSSSRHFAGLQRGVEKGEGWSLDIFTDWQYAKGDQRINLMIIDLGNVRAVVEL